jgi:hypothetical protein
MLSKALNCVSEKCCTIDCNVTELKLAVSTSPNPHPQSWRMVHKIERGRKCPRPQPISHVLQSVQRGIRTETHPNTLEKQFTISRAKSGAGRGGSHLHHMEKRGFFRAGIYLLGWLNRRRHCHLSHEWSWKALPLACHSHFHFHFRPFSFCFLRYFSLQFCGLKIFLGTLLKSVIQRDDLIFYQNQPDMPGRLERLKTQDSVPW